MKNIISLIYGTVDDNIDIKDKLVVVGDFELPRNAIFIPDKVSGQNVDAGYNKRMDVSVWFAVEHALIDATPFLLENQDLEVVARVDYKRVTNDGKETIYMFYCEKTGLLLIPNNEQFLYVPKTKYVPCNVYDIGVYNERHKKNN